MLEFTIACILIAGLGLLCALCDPNRYLRKQRTGLDWPDEEYRRHHEPVGGVPEEPEPRGRVDDDATFIAERDQLRDDPDYQAWYEENSVGLWCGWVHASIEDYPTPDHYFVEQYQRVQAQEAAEIYD